MKRCGGQFIVRDNAGTRLFLLRERVGPRSPANLRTKDEARRMPVNFAKLPELLRGEELKGV
jgi:hypothetical protein